MDEKRRKPEEFGLKSEVSSYEEPEKALPYWLQFPLEDFVPIAAHDARTDLSRIETIMRLLIEEAESGSIVLEGRMSKKPLAEWLEWVIQSVERLDNVLTVMVGYSKKYGKSSDE